MNTKHKEGDKVLRISASDTSTHYKDRYIRDAFICEADSRENTICIAATQKLCMTNNAGLKKLY